MNPYYEHAGITIYHGDCREILPHVTADVVVTDPPYGIGVAKMSLGKWRTSRMEKSAWDDAPADVSWIHASGLPAIVWGGNYFALPPSRGFLVWNKGAGFSGRDFAECEMAWCSLDGNARVFTYDPLAAGDYREKQHPTQKPVALMRWCLSFVPDGTVLDPFMGSGTTLVAAKQLGRRAISIEIEERYCEIAAKRLAQEVFDFGPTPHEPQQETLVLP